MAFGDGCSHISGKDAFFCIAEDNDTDQGVLQDTTVPTGDTFYKVPLIMGSTSLDLNILDLITDEDVAKGSPFLEQLFINFYDSDLVVVVTPNAAEVHEFVKMGMHLDPLDAAPHTPLEGYGCPGSRTIIYSPGDSTLQFKASAIVNAWAYATARKGKNLLTVGMKLVGEAADTTLASDRNRISAGISMYRGNVTGLPGFGGTSSITRNFSFSRQVVEVEPDFGGGATPVAIAAYRYGEGDWESEHQDESFVSDYDSRAAAKAGTAIDLSAGYVLNDGVNTCTLKFGDAVITQTGRGLNTGAVTSQTTARVKKNSGGLTIQLDALA